MRTKQILVVGGAGYIGSHMVDFLKKNHYQPIVLDNLSTGHKESIQEHEFILGEMTDENLLDRIFSQYSIAAVMHFAAKIQVNESVAQPLHYYQNNVAGTIKLLQAMLKWKVNKFIFSSTAAVYGEPQYSPIDENHPLQPINPYGYSKRMVEQILEDTARAHDFNVAILRYFNAAGADPAGKLKEQHEPESHLIPLILQTAKGIRKSIAVYGRDYPTEDGTCIRDYIHVTDLCSAHELALQQLFENQKMLTYNLGTGLGYSVQQVISAARKVTQCDIKVVEGERRFGDPAILVANPNRAMTELNWKPQFSELETILKHAWLSMN